MKYLISLALLTVVTNSAIAQKFITRTGQINFVSQAPIETITAVNKSTACVLDAKSGSIDVVTQIKSFVFEKQLMQEHFNENYMESDKFPKASFKGKITNLQDINFNKDGTYDAQVDGQLSIHGITKDVKEAGKVTISNGKASIKTSFSVLLADYKINIPAAVKDKVAKEVKINLTANLDEAK